MLALLLCAALSLQNGGRVVGFTYSSHETVTRHEPVFAQPVEAVDVTFDHINSGNETYREHTGGGAFGASYCDNLTLVSCRFISCWTTERFGGGAFCCDNVNYALVSKCTIESCFGWRDGGALLFNGTEPAKNVHIEYSSIRNCTTHGDGGAVKFILGFERFVLSNTNISDCVAPKSGGAIFSSATSLIGSLEVSKSLITNNTAENGGGFYLSHVSTVLFNQQANVVLNEAKSSKSIYLSEYSEAHFHDSLFHVDRSKGDGVSFSLLSTDASSTADFNGCCFNSTISSKRINGPVHMLGDTKGSVSFRSMCFDLGHDESVSFTGEDPSQTGTDFHCVNCIPPTSASQTPIPPTEPSATATPTESPEPTSTSSSTVAPTSMTASSQFSPTASASFTDEGHHGALSETAIAILSVSAIVVVSVVIAVALICLRRRNSKDAEGLDSTALMNSTSRYDTNFSTVTEVLAPADLETSLE